jgi:hypothetical protein
MQDGNNTDDKVFKVSNVTCGGSNATSFVAETARATSPDDSSGNDKAAGITGRDRWSSNFIRFWSLSRKNKAQQNIDASTRFDGSLSYLRLFDISLN